MTDLTANRPSNSQPAQLPAIPKTGLPAVDKAIDAIREHLEVRSGARGNPWERGVTLRDLRALGMMTAKGDPFPSSNSLVTIGTSPGTVMIRKPDGTYTSATFEVFAAALRQTQLWKDVQRRLDDASRFDNLPEEVRSILGADLMEQANARGAEILRLEQKIQEQGRSFASSVTEVTAAIGQLAAGVRQTTYAFADQNRATAGAVTQVSARLDGFGGGTASVEEVMTAIADRATGLEAQWTLKVNAGGAFAAIGAAATSPVAGVSDSYLIFVANNFAFVKPTDTIGTGPGQVDPTNPGASRIPFGIDSDGVIYLNGTVRINANGTAIANVANLTYIGAFSSAPSTAGLKKNNFYKNTTDGNSYILTADGGAWSLWVAKGTDGASGNRGSLTLYASGGSWSDATANAAVVAATGSGARAIGDTVTISNGSSFAATKYWSGSAWVDPGVVINGNLLVNGTLSALMFDGVGIKIGTGHTPSGKAFEVLSGGTVHADNLFVGILSADNSNSLTASAVVAFTHSTLEGAVGGVDAANSSTSAHGLRGYNYNKACGGIIGAGNGYDFYADGSGTNYGPFTGTHDGLVPKAANGWVQGDLLVDVVCVARKNVSNTIFEVARSSKANQKGVIGILASDLMPLDDYPPAALLDGHDTVVNEQGQEHARPRPAASYASVQQTYSRVAVNALGEGQINVCGQGGNIAIGDFIVASDRPGKGMKQADDVAHSYTVARAREAVTFSGPGDVKMVACVYLCG